MSEYKNFENEEDLPAPSSPFRPRTIDFLRASNKQQLIKSKVTEETQLQSHTFDKIKKSHSMEKFDTFIGWIESKKSLDPTKVYQNAENFKFLSDGDGEKRLKIEFEVNFLAISPNGKFFAVGNESSGVQLWDLLSEHKILDYKDETFRFKDTCMALGNHYLYTGGWDKNIKQWSNSSGKLIKEFLGHRAPILALALSEDEDVMASGAEENHLMVWDMNLREVKAIMEAHSSPIAAVVIPKNSRNIISGSWDKLIRVWSYPSLEKQFELAGHKDLIRTLGLSADQRFLASGGDDKLVKVWDLEAKQEIHSFHAHKSCVTGVQFSNDGGLVASSSSDKTIRIWNLKKNELKKTIEAHKEPITSLILSRDGKRLISGSLDRVVRIANFEKDYERHLFTGHRADVLTIAVFPDNVHAVSGGHDKTLRVWAINSATLLKELEGHLESITAVSVDSDGQQMFSGDTSGKILIWDAKTLTLKTSLSIHKQEIKFIRCIESRAVLSCGSDNIVNFFNCKNFSVYSSFTKVPSSITALEILPDGSTMFLAYAKDPTVRSIDTQSFERVFEFKDHSAEVVSIRLSQNLRFLVTGCLNGVIIIWDVATRYAIQRISSGSEVYCIEMMNNNYTIISSHADKTIRLWDYETKEQIGVTEVAMHPTKAMALTPDSSTLICTGEKDFIMRRVILNKIKTKHVLNYHKREINVVTLSRDQQILAVGSNDRTISLWSTKTMKLEGHLDGHIKPVQCLAFSPDSKQLFSGAEDNTIRVWDVEKKKEINISKHFVGNVTSLWIYQIEILNEKESGIRLLASSSDQSIAVFDEKLKHLKSQKIKEGEINIVISTHSGKKCFSAGQSANILAHRLSEDSLESLHQFKAHNGGVFSLVTTEKDDMLCSSGADATVRIWSISDDEKSTLLHTMSTSHNVSHLILNWKGNNLFTVHAKRIFIWNLTNFKKIKEFECENAKVHSICLSADETTLYSGSSDCQVRAWNLIDCKELPFIEGHTNAVMSMAISSDYKHLATGDSNGLLIVTDLQKQKEKYTVEIGLKIKDLVFTKDNSRIITIHSSRNEGIGIWSTENGSLIDRFGFKDLLPKSILLIHDDQHMILGFNDSSIGLCNFEKKKVDKTLLGHCGGVHALALLKDKLTLISGGSDTQIIMWNMKSLQIIQTLKGHDDAVRSLLPSADENLLFSGGDDRKILIWDLKTFQVIRTLEGHQARIKKIALGPDNDRLFVSCSPSPHDNIDKIKCLYVWNLTSYQLIGNFDEPNRGFAGMVVKKDTKQVITAGIDKTIRVFDYETDKLRSRYPGHSSQLTSIGIAKSRSVIALGDGDSVITVWNLRTNSLLARLEGHQEQINALIVTRNMNVISASSDRKIGFWSINEGKLVSFMQGHNAEVLAMAITEDETRLLTAGNDVTVRLWDLENRIQIKKFQSGLDRIMALCFFSDQKSFLAGGSQRHLKLWNLENDDSEPVKLAILNAGIASITISPNSLLFVIVLVSKKMQIWDARNYTMMSEITECPNLINQPVFLSNHYNRLILFFDKLIDCFTGEVLFRFAPPQKILAYFYDIDNRMFFFLSNNYKFMKFENDYFIDYLLNYINNDSLLALSKNSDIICNRSLSSFPYLFSFLHLISIYEKNELFTLEKLTEIYSPYTNNFLTKFYNVDMFSNTPLDILIQRKNMNLIVKYFNLLFAYLNTTSCDFYQKIRFFVYNFRNDYTIANLLLEMIPMMGHDLSIISELFNQAFMPFDPAIYDNSLLATELDEPILIESDSIYVDKHFIDIKIKEYCREKKENENKSEPQENCSIVKAKILCLPGLCDISQASTFDFISNISDLNSNNPIFKNKQLVLLVNFIWEQQTIFLFRFEMWVFIFYFVLFNLNFAFLRDLRNSNETQVMLAACGVIDVILFIYALFCMANELRQFFNSSNYFKSVWNYFDISLIPLLLISSSFDLVLTFYTFEEGIGYIELSYALCAFCFWFRFLSYFRAFKETSSMIGLILNVISGVKYFMLFMILFIFTLTTTFYILQEEATGSFYDYWNTFLYFYHSATGDTSGITSTALVFDNLNQYFGIISTFLFYIISLNLLVSIIGDKRSDCKSMEEEIRIYELTNMIVDTHCSLLTQIVNFFRKNKPIGVYLIQLYNENHETKEVDRISDLELQIKDLKTYMDTTIENKISGLKKENERMMEKHFKEIKELVKATGK